MEHKILLGALTVGCVGWLCLLMLALRGQSTPSIRCKGSLFDWLALALPVIVWLATLPTKAPFSAGQGWGRGFLLGGLISFISIYIVFRVGKASNKGRLLATISLFGSLVVACIPLLWMRNAVIEALMGAALGWCVVSLVWLCGSSLQSSSEIGDSPSSTLGLLNGSTFATTLCGVAALGVYRDFVVSDVARGTHPAIAVVIAASISLALLPVMLLNEAETDERETPTSTSLPRVFQGITVFLCFIVPIGIGFLLGTKVLDDLKVVYCLATGSVLSLLGWGLLWDTTHRENNISEQPTLIPPVTILVVLCAFMFAYSLLQGFGVGLMLLAAWPVSILLWPALTSDKQSRIRLDVAQTVSLLGAFLAVLLMSRVFATRFRADLRGVNLVDQFALFGFLAGALVPTWLASLWFGTKEKYTHSAVSLLRLFGVGILALLLPSAMFAIWGIKVMPAFFAGMALALAGWGATSGAPTRAYAVALFAQALALVVTQWTVRFLPLADVSRTQRMHFLLWGLGGSVVLVLVIDFGARLLVWSQQRNRGGGSEPTPGVSS